MSVAKKLTSCVFPKWVKSNEWRKREEKGERKSLKHWPATVANATTGGAHKLPESK